MNKLKLAPDVLLKVFDEEGVIVDFNNDKVFELNQPGARIVELLEEGHPVEQVSDLLAQEYQVDGGGAGEAVRALTKTLLDRGLVVER